MTHNQGLGDTPTKPEDVAAPRGGDAQPESNDTRDSRRKEMSTIDFPYNDLDSAITVARALHDNAGLECTPDQMAAYLKLMSNSGGFRARIAPARTFGLIQVERGKISLTELGQRILDPAREVQARIDAFLHVGLYREIFDKYRNGRLPGAAGLESSMAAMGVSSRQTGKARQAFERSANQAGFFREGRDRLVMPATQAKSTPALAPTIAKA